MTWGFLSLLEFSTVFLKMNSCTRSLKSGDVCLYRFTAEIYPIDYGIIPREFILDTPPLSLEYNIHAARYWYSVVTGCSLLVAKLPTPLVYHIDLFSIDTRYLGTVSIIYQIEATSVSTTLSYFLFPTLPFSSLLEGSALSQESFCGSSLGTHLFAYWVSLASPFKSSFQTCRAIDNSQYWWFHSSLG